MRRSWWMLAAAVFIAALFGVGTLVPRYIAIRPGLSGCTTITDDDRLERCLVNRGRSQVRDTSLAKAAQEFDKAAASSSRIDSRCHPALHDIAEPIGKRAARDGEPVPVVEGRANCSQGMAHGLMIGYLADASWKQIADFDPEDCAGMPAGATAEPSAPLTTCLHSLGHRLFQERPELEEGFVACQAITKRAGVAQDAAERLVVPACAGGMLMERTFADPSSAAECPTSSRTSEAREFGLACVRYLGINMAQVGAKAPAIVARCNAYAKDEDLSAACGSGLATVLTDGDDCDQLEGAGRQTCSLSFAGARGELDMVEPASADDDA